SSHGRPRRARRRARGTRGGGGVRASPSSDAPVYTRPMRRTHRTVTRSGSLSGAALAAWTFACGGAQPAPEALPATTPSPSAAAPAPVSKEAPQETKPAAEETKPSEPAAAPSEAAPSE